MKKLFITSIIILVFAAGANAQIGMPKELTCTETAFNFSFSVGNNWKFVTPKMGPVEVRNNDPVDISAVQLKINNTVPEMYLPVSPEMLFNAGALSHHNAFYASAPKALDMSIYQLPDPHFNVPINYTLFKPVSVSL